MSILGEVLVGGCCVVLCSSGGVGRGLVSSQVPYSSACLFPPLSAQLNRFLFWSQQALCSDRFYAVVPVVLPNQGDIHSWSNSGATQTSLDDKVIRGRSHPNPMLAFPCFTFAASAFTFLSYLYDFFEQFYALNFTNRFADVTALSHISKTSDIRVTHRHQFHTELHTVSESNSHIGGSPPIDFPGLLAYGTCSCTLPIPFNNQLF